MKAVYARWVFEIGAHGGLTDRAVEVLNDTLADRMDDILDAVTENLRAALPGGLDDALWMKWREERV
jgi:hypothetical protein